MSEFTRRQMLTTAAATAAATALTPLAALGPAHAAAPPAGKQAPGFYRYKVGSIEVTAVTDGVSSWPLDNFVKNAPREAVVAALAAAYQDKEEGKVTIPYTPIVVNTGTRLVVIDPGYGPNALEQSKGALGQFHTNLAAAGIDRNLVDAVIISHFHPDHVNGLLTADGKLAFPNAEVMVPAVEWKHQFDDMSRAPAGSLLEANFKNNQRVFGALGNKVTHYEPDKELVPGITSVTTYGHTLGHTSHVIASGSAKVMVQADVTVLPALFVRNPGWHVMFDGDAAMAEQTRRRVYDMAFAEKMPIQGFHYPFPALGYVEKDGNGYRLIPVLWNPTL